MVIIAGLQPILWGSGAGSKVMKRIAAPMTDGGRGDHRSTVVDAGVAGGLLVDATQREEISVRHRKVTGLPGTRVTWR